MAAFADSDPSVRLMQVLSGRYAFLALLGRGGSGLVFEVENRQLGRREALKFLSQNLDRDASQRFAYEAKIMAGMEHPHIVPIYAFGEDEGCLWYSMKLVEGPTLGAYVKTAHVASVPEALQVAIPVLEALSLIHGRGVIHRDIKPANILLDPQVGPLVTDFGVAKREGNPLLTETGMLVGTPAYVSPEQSLGQKLDGRTDLYALGVTLYQVMTGNLPFSGNSLSIFLQRIQEEPPALRALRPDVPEAIAAVITRAMERQLDRRFGTAREMREAFIQAAEGCGVDWQGPLSVPANAGPRREALPEYLTAHLVQRGTSSEFVTSASVVLPDSSAPTPSPILKGQKAGWSPARLALVALPVLLLASWGALRMRQNAGRPSMPLARPEPAPPTPDIQKHPASMPQLSTRAHSVSEPEPIRRAVIPPRLQEPPKVLLVEGSPCAGQSVTVEVQVDESGAVTGVRLLSKIQAGCADPVLKAVRACHFTPAKAADGQPVVSTVALAIEL